MFSVAKLNDFAVGIILTDESPVIFFSLSICQKSLSGSRLSGFQPRGFVSFSSLMFFLQVQTLLYQREGKFPYVLFLLLLSISDKKLVSSFVILSEIEILFSFLPLLSTFSLLPSHLY